MRGVRVLLVAFIVHSVVSQDIREPKPCKRNIDLTLLVDASSSVEKVKEGQRNWDDVKDLLANILDTVVYRESNVRVALVTFNDVATVHFDLSECDNRFCMDRKIEFLAEPSGRADYDIGFDTCLNRIYKTDNGDRPNNLDIVFFITSNEEEKDLKESSKRILDAGIRLVIAGVSENPNHQLLRSLVSYPKTRNYFAGEDYEMLGNITNHLQMGICPAKLKPEPRQAAPVEGQARCLFDVVVLQDKSGSIIDTPNFFQNWVDTRFFLVDFMTKFATADSRLVQLAFVTFASLQQLWFNFGECTTAECVEEAVYKPGAPIGETHMVEAFDFVRQNVINSRNNRPGAEDLIIFITDGFPNPPQTQALYEITREIKDAGARIFAIGITRKVNTTIMRRVVSSPFSENYIQVLDYTELTERVSEILEVSCPITPNVWSPWGEWGVCSCDGFQSRRRSCITVDCQGNAEDRRRCRIPDSCNRGWASWSVWSACQCSPNGIDGIWSRTRVCNDVAGACPGPSFEEGNCDLPLGCQTSTWNQWTQWSDCNPTCGPAIQSRTRTCNIVGGLDCGVEKFESRSCNNPPCEEWSSWTSWSTCSCADNSQSRRRECLGGVNCPGTGFESQTCTPENCQAWGTWSNWGGCSCATRSRSRSRTCLNGDGCPGFATENDACTPINCQSWGTWSNWGGCSCTTRSQSRSRSCLNGNDCPGFGTDSQTCTPRNCQAWGTWSNWGGCSCTTRSQSRSRSCLNGNGCPGFGTDSQTCTPRNCQGSWSLWDNWSRCSVTCGSGTKTRGRTCSGDDCPGAAVETTSCSIANCRRNQWSEWEDWCECSQTCDTGFQIRKRQCLTFGCQGPLKESKFCTNPPCRASTWNNWGSWTCSVTCGIGTRTRTRTCATVNNIPCFGSETDSSSCNPRICPAWSLWSNWGSCSVSCGQGTETRRRSCASGSGCQGSPVDTRACGRECATWTNWGQWSCSVTCGRGTDTRSRTCSFGSNCVGDSIVSRECNRPACSSWGRWGEWNTCTATCGIATKTRFRTCNGAGNCPGPDTDRENCAVPACFRWGGWSDWTQCTCNGRSQSRSRNCEGGTGCSGDSFETKTCNPLNCAVWSSWGDWGTCSDTCGDGSQQRYRTCSKQQGYTGNCEGRSSENNQCNRGPCPAWGQWQNWGRCTATCGRATRSRIRSCTGLGNNCPGAGVQEENCNVPTCFRWGGWSEWSGCTCNGRSQSRSRNCEGGTGCSGNPSETRSCTPLDCALWSSWGEWGICTHSCGDGSQQRYRTCSKQQGYTGDCQGQSSQSNNCNLRPCPEWGIWNTWSQCTCDQRLQTRNRLCSSGSSCTGSSLEQRNCNPTDCWGEWSSYSSCSASCGIGTRRRSRTCNGGTIGTGGCFGNSEETINCNGAQCPTWGEWSGYGGCSTTCGNGVRRRSRTCSIIGRCQGITEDTTNCNAGQCPIWGVWSSYGACSVSCGSGIRRRTRACSITGSCPGNFEETNSCNSGPCPTWGLWSVYGGCSVTCGDGVRRRRRSCNVIGGCQGNAEDTTSCNAGSCASWGLWGLWGSCSATCGIASRTRHRTCQGSFPGSNACPGSASDFRNCAVPGCITSFWNQWSGYGACSASCGVGEEARTRSCSGGFPGDAGCLGPERMTRSCNAEQCGEWGAWDFWSICSASCNGGSRTRNRNCIGGTIGFGSCQPVSAATQQFSCNTQSCGEWGLWNVWTACSANCNGGTRTRSRNCNGGSPGFGGCQPASGSFEQVSCNQQPCASWSQWGGWNACSNQCGTGTRSRTRTCNGGTAGGPGCPGLTFSSEQCNGVQCGGWGNWGSWSGCSNQCGLGQRTRARTCVGGTAGTPGCPGAPTETQQCSGTQCSAWGFWGAWSTCSNACGAGQRTRARTCNGVGCTGSAFSTEPCVGNQCAGWGRWGQWSVCPVSCGGGQQIRARQCIGNTGGLGSCTGLSQDVRSCNAQDCPIVGTCGGPRFASSVPQIIRSPVQRINNNIPSSETYPVDVTCTWQISSSFGTVIIVDLQQVQIQCRDDDFYMKQNSSTDFLILRNCGDTNPDGIGSSNDLESTSSVYQSDRNTLVVKFISGMFPNGENRGLRLRFWSIPTPAICPSQVQQIFTEGGEIESHPNFALNPITYYRAGDIRCQWKITAPFGNRVLLVFESFMVICADYVILFDGTASSGILCRPDSNLQGQFAYISNTNTMDVVFQGTGAKVWGGFKATIEFVEPGRNAGTVGARGLQNDGRSSNLRGLREEEKELRPMGIPKGFMDMEYGIEEKINCGLPIDEATQPWHVTLLYKDTASCSGVIINKRWVLTSADCVHQDDKIVKASELVIVSRNNVDTANAKITAGRKIYINKILVHPKYDKDAMTHNTALLWLRKPVKFNDELSPVCLPVAGMVSKLNCTTNGYTDDAELKAVNLTDRVDCVDEKPELDTKVKKGHLCEGGIDSFSGPCLELRGSAITCKADGRHRIYALSLWDKDSCLDKPPTHIEVATSIHWIRSYYYLGSS